MSNIKGAHRNYGQVFEQMRKGELQPQQAADQIAQDLTTAQKKGGPKARMALAREVEKGMAGLKRDMIQDQVWAERKVLLAGIEEGGIVPADQKDVFVDKIEVFRKSLFNNPKHGRSSQAYKDVRALKEAANNGDPLDAEVLGRVKEFVEAQSVVVVEGNIRKDFKALLKQELGIGPDRDVKWRAVAAGSESISQPGCVAETGEVTPTSPDKYLSTPIDADQCFKSAEVGEEGKEHMAVIGGSAFRANTGFVDKYKDKEGTGPGQSLDSGKATVANNGMTISVASDGYGHSNPYQTYAEAKSSTQAMIDSIGHYATADALEEAAVDLILDVDYRVGMKGTREGGGAGLSMVAAVPNPEKAGEDLVCAGLGDCMAFAFDPNTGEVVSLLDAVQVGREGGFNPLGVKHENLRDEKAMALKRAFVQQKRQFLQDGWLVFNVTDGAYDVFPTKTTKDSKQVSEKTVEFFRTSIDAAAFQEEFNAFIGEMSPEQRPTSPEQYANLMKVFIAGKYEAIRVQSTQCFAALNEYFDANEKIEATTTLGELKASLPAGHPLHEQLALADSLFAASRIDTDTVLLDTDTVEALQYYMANYAQGDDTTLVITKIDSTKTARIEDGYKPAIIKTAQSLLARVFTIPQTGKAAFFLTRTILLLVILLTLGTTAVVLNQKKA